MFIFLSLAAPKARDGRYCNAPRPSVRPSVRPSRLFFALLLKNALMYFLETLQVHVCAPCHGGVLYSFWYWLNVVWIFYEFFKYLIFYFIFFSIFQVFFAFHVISDIKKKFGVKKNPGGWVFFLLFFWF